MTAIEHTKICNRCKEVRPLKKFAKCKTEKDGFQRTCKVCQKAYRTANEIAISEKNKRYYERNRQRIIARVGEYGIKNKEAITEYKREWYHSNKDALSEINKAYRQENKEKIREQRKAYRQENKEKIQQMQQQWVEANRERVAHTKQKWAIENPEKKSSATELWRKQNPDKVTHYTALRRATHKRAIPAWAEIETLSTLYAEARVLAEETGEPHHVDHIVPLQSPHVCGLHCRANLQILPGKENISKGNRTWPGIDWVTHDTSEGGQRHG